MAWWQWVVIGLVSWFALAVALGIFIGRRLR